LKIVHLCSYDIAGGAARSAYRLHTGLKKMHQDSIMFVENKQSEDPSVVVFNPTADFFTRLKRYMRWRRINRDFEHYRKTLPSWLELFSDDRTRYGTPLINQIPNSDVINLHWVARFMDYEAFFSSVPQRTPIVWTLHDMNAFTGGCHYDNGCRKFEDSCGACPQLGSKVENDLSRGIWGRKKNVFDNADKSRLHIVTPSKWLATEAQRSSLFKQFSVSVIPYGFNQEVFAQRDAYGFRKAFDISEESQVLLFIADYVANQRKGFHLLIDAVRSLDKNSNLVLLSVGEEMPKLDTDIRHIHLGRIYNDRLLSLIYSSADVFIVPSLQDNLPNTVLEAMSCGTPVVGFDTGGIPDMVFHGKTGLLAQPKNVNDLSEKIQWMIDHPDDGKQMGINARKHVVEKFTLEIQATRYIDLYSKLLSSS
jgi:glycosyltransferase involved in cell wall biosynthesis